MPFSVPARSKAWLSGRSPAGTAGSNPTGRHGYLSVVSVVCCAGGGLCDGLITRTEESYRLWCVAVLCVVQVEVCATGCSLVQRIPTDCAASLCVN